MVAVADSIRPVPVRILLLVPVGGEGLCGCCPLCWPRCCCLLSCCLCCGRWPCPLLLLLLTLLPLLFIGRFIKTTQTGLTDYVYKFRLHLLGLDDVTLPSPMLLNNALLILGFYFLYIVNCDGILFGTRLVNCTMRFLKYLFISVALPFATCNVSQLSGKCCKASRC